MGAADPPMGRSHHGRRGAGAGKVYAELSSTMLEARDRWRRRAPTCALCRASSRPSSARTSELGRKRPDEINALIEQVRTQLDAARRLRLARDQSAERAGSFAGVSKGC